MQITFNSPKSLNSVHPLKPASAPPEMSGRIETVTPELAQSYLDRSLGNRNIRDRLVRKYARDIVTGRFRVHHQGIAFTPNGVFIDGHHRMHAIIKTGISVRLFVVRNCETEGLAYIDTSANRTITDSMRMAGDTQPPSHKVFAIARVLKHMPMNAKSMVIATITRSEQIEEYETHREAIDWALSITLPQRSRGLCCHGRAAIARAFYYMNPTDRDAFASAVRGNGPAAPRDAGLTPWLIFMANNPKMNANGGEERYCRAQGVIARFMDHQVSVMCKPVMRDLFPYIDDPSALPS